MADYSKSFCSPEEEIEIRKGPWTVEEDTLLIHYIACHGDGRWNLLAKSAGLKRTGKSCRLRWSNYLKPDVKRGNLTSQEQLLILELHSIWGNRWSRIAQHLPGRTDNEIKNYWRTKVQKQARQLNIESNSKRFDVAVRCFWTPRLLQKMEQDVSTSNNANDDNYSSSSATTMNSQKNSLPLSTSYHPIKYSSSVSMDISELPEISEHQTSPHAFGNTFYHSPFLNDYYADNNSTYDLQHMNQAPMSATGINNDISFTDCQLAESNWVDAGDDVAGAMWNTDELWQFR